MNATRVYRGSADGQRLTSFTVTVKESDLWIAVSSSAYHENLPSAVEKVIWNRRRKIESYLALNPAPGASLGPCPVDSRAPELFRRMTRAGNRAGVGPMAAVAGAIAEEAGAYLLGFSDEVIVENGGDIFLKVSQPARVGIYAGNSPLSGKLALQVNPSRAPLGVCTSSGTVGPSFSRGRADAAVVLSASTTLADAAATALGNMVQDPGDLETALGFARRIEGVTGALVICDCEIAAWGDVELLKT